MHAGSLIEEFDTIYTQKGHGKQLRENNTKLTEKDENADLDLHERIVFCHILDMRENLEKKRQGEFGDTEAAICGYKRFKREASPKAMSESPEEEDNNTELNSVISYSDHYPEHEETPPAEDLLQDTSI